MSFSTTTATNPVMVVLKKLHSSGQLDMVLAADLDAGKEEVMIDGKLWRRDSKVSIEGSSSYRLETILNFLRGIAPVRKTDRPALFAFFDSDDADPEEEGNAPAAKKPRNDSTKTKEEGKNLIDKLSIELATDNNSNTSNNTNSIETVSPFDNLSTELVAKIFSNLERSFLIGKVSLVCKRFKDICMDTFLWTELTRVPKGLSASFALIQKCQQLKSLSLSYQQHNMFVAIKALECCPLLEQLNITMSLSSDNNFGIINAEMLLQMVAGYGRALRKLSLTGEWDCKELSKEAVIGLHNLTELRLKSLKGYSLDVWMALRLNCKNLQSFDLEYEELNGSQAMEIFLPGVANTLKKLEFGSFATSGYMVTCVGECKQLEHLNIVGVELSRAGLEAIASLSKLKHLSFSNLGGSTVDSASFSLAFGKRRLHNLVHLRLLDSSLDITDRIVKIIADNCPKLTYLDVSRSENITDYGVSDVLRKCKHLEELGVYQVTVAAFARVNTTVTKLRRLAIDADDGKMIVKEDMEAIKVLIPWLELSIGDLKYNELYGTQDGSNSSDEEEEEEEEEEEYSDENYSSSDMG